MTLSTRTRVCALTLTLLVARTGAQDAAGEVAVAGDSSLSSALQDLRAGEYGDAAQGFEEVLKKTPDEARAARGWSEALTAQGQYDEALEVLRAFRDHRQSALTLVAEGRIHLRRGALAKAKEALRAALVLDSQNVEAIHRLGETLAKEGNLTEARELWTRVIDIYQAMSFEEAESSPASTFVEMGLALIGLNRFKEANSVMFEQAQERDESSPDLLLAWGRVLKAKYNYPESRDALRDAIDENPRFADALIELADNYLVDFQVGTKRYDLARKQVEKALAVNPRHAGAFVIRGQLALSDGDLESGRADFQKAVELDPSSLRARGLVATCHFLSGETEALEKSEADALALNPKGAEYFHTIAKAIESKFRYRDVVRFCDRALELDAEYWPAFVTLGINCLRTGEEKRGREFLERSWAQDKFNVWVYNTRLLLKHMDDNHRELKTTNFVFKLPRRDFDALALYLPDLLEKAHERLTKRYRTSLKGPTSIEAFSDHKWFSARTVGLEGFAASGACFGNLVTLTTARALPQNWAAVALHEFAHVVTLTKTHHRVPRWFTEGLSVLEEGSENSRWSRPFEREIADAYGSGRLLPLAELDFGFSKPKYPNQILISYYQGCLIATYIRDKWGFEKLVSMLDGYEANKGTRQIVREVLGLSLEEFDTGFFSHVARWVEKTGYQPTLAPEVIPRLELELEADPKNLPRKLKLAWAYYCSGNDVDAPRVATEVAEADAANGDAHSILGLSTYRFEKKPEAAKEQLEKGLELGTKYAFRAHAALGAIAEKGGDKDAAVVHYEKAVEISPRAGAGRPGPQNLYYRLSGLYSTMGRDEEAVRTMESLRQFTPADAKCRSMIAAHYMKQGGDEATRKAMEALQEILYINPFGKRLHQDLARLASQVGDADICIREYEYLLQFPDTNPKVAYLALAKAYDSRGNGKKAKEYASKLLELDEDNAEAKALLEKQG